MLTTVIECIYEKYSGFVVFVLIFGVLMVRMSGIGSLVVCFSWVLQHHVAKIMAALSRYLRINYGARRTQFIHLRLLLRNTPEKHLASYFFLISASTTQYTVHYYLTISYSNILLFSLFYVLCTHTKYRCKYEKSL